MYRKISSVLTVLFLTPALLTTACGTDSAGNSHASTEQSAEQKAAAITDSDAEAGAAAITDSDAAAEAAVRAGSDAEAEAAVMADSDAEAKADAEAISALPELIQFTVDITDNRSAQTGQIIGNTASDNSYSGVITINLDETLAGRAASEIQAGETWIFTVTPMMTRSIPPQVSATDFMQADADDIARLEKIREAISGYEDCMRRYQSEGMSLEDIIQDANTAYATWTQAEIAEYIAFITEKGYTDAFPRKSYVSLRENLNGSIYGAEDE